MITDFPSQPLANIAGYTDFQFAPHYTVSAIPQAVNKIISDPVEFIAPYNFLTGYATVETLEFQEESKRTPQGTVYDQVISGFVPGDTDALADLMEFMEGSSLRYIVALTPFTGKRRLVGTVVPLEFSSELVPGKAVGERRGYAFKFSAVSTSRAVFYNV